METEILAGGAVEPSPFTSLGMPMRASAFDAGLALSWAAFERLDGLRVAQGKWLEALGWGPRPAPSRSLAVAPGAALRVYSAHGPPILLVPAPIKRDYIWDLAPGSSVVQSCLAAGWRPFLVNWREPVPGAGLTAFAGHMLSACLRKVMALCGERPVVLAGHSLGGVFAAIHAALHPEAVAALVLLATPLRLSPSGEAGALGPMMSAIDRRGLARTLPERVPGSLLSQSGFFASPAAFGIERWRDWIDCLSDPEAMRTHMRVERWSLDEMPMPRQLAVDLVESLWRENAFLAGRLQIGGRALAPADIVAPLLIVADEGCPVVPPAAILPFCDRVASRDKRVLWYAGDVGVAIRHLGPLLGQSAHARLWPEILSWAGELAA